MVVTEIADRSGESAVPLGLLTFNTEGSVRTAYAAHRIQWALCVRLFFLSRFGGWRRPAFEREVTGSARSMSMINDAPRFEAVTHFDGSEATVVLTGSVENAAAPRSVPPLTRPSTATRPR
jgi:hypothetical protein